MHSSFLMGACFAENIAEQMLRYKLGSMVNPGGILYNPLSIAASVQRYMSDAQFKAKDLFFANGLWNSWEHHSRFSNPHQQACLHSINTNISEAHSFLKHTDWLFITFGSAFVYKRNGLPVGNCHKQAQSEFVKELLTEEEVVTEYESMIKQLQLFNPKLKIVFTISPVRYIRDGVVENNISKAVLIRAVHTLVKQHAHVLYFPSYELVIDDLRDYRFYKADLVHPNQQAIDYVFEKWKAAYFDQQSEVFFERVKELVNAYEHRPFQENSNEHKKFKAALFLKAKKMQEEFPHLDLKKELDHFCS